MRHRGVILTGRTLVVPGGWRAVALDDPEIPAPVELELRMVADDLRRLGFGGWSAVTRPIGSGAIYAIGGEHAETATRRSRCWGGPPSGGITGEWSR